MSKLLTFLGVLLSLLVIWVLVEVVFFGAPIPSLWFGSVERPALSKLILSGDYDALVYKSQKAAEDAGSPQEFRAAKHAEAYGQFMLGSTQSRVEAVRIARDLYISAETDRQRAKAINQILELVTTSRSPEVFNEVFGKEPFSKYRTSEVNADAVAALAAESYQYEPSVIARAFMLIPHSDPLVYAKVGTLDIDKASIHVEAIRDGLRDLSKAYADEVLRPMSDVERVTLSLTYWYWYSYFTSAAARVDSTFRQVAEDAYRRLFQTYETTRDESGSPFPILTVRMPDYHMFYVRYLLDVVGESARDEAAAHVKIVVDMVSNNPELHEPGYIAKLRGLATGKGMGQVTGMRLLRQAADVYPPFKDFVARYGVVL